MKGSMALSSDKSSLLVDLNVADLSATVPTGASAEDWYMTWTYGGTEYFAQASLSATPGSAPRSATDGFVTGNEHQYETAHTDTGTFTPGTNGVVEVVVPLANVGNPPLRTSR